MILNSPLMKKVVGNVSNKAGNDKEVKIEKIEIDTVRKAILELMDKDPAIIDKIKYLMEIEKTNPAGAIAETYSDTGMGWEIEDQKLPPKDISKMYKAGIVVKCVKTNRHTVYALSPAVYDVIDEMDSAGILDEVEMLQSTSIPDDLFDNIVGFDDVKELVKFAIHSEKQVHILFVGPPATAKTLFLMEIERLPGAKYSVGSGSTGVGVRDTLIENDYNYLLIDEIEKMNRDDLSALLSVMETGRLIVMKHKMNVEVHRNTKVFAAANSIKGLPKELLSRFLVIKIDEYEPEQLCTVVENVCRAEVDQSLPDDVKEEIVKEIADTVKETAGLKNGITIREAIKVARMSRSKKDAEKILMVLAKYRAI